jgi:hypothetical protein
MSQHCTIATCKTSSCSFFNHRRLSHEKSLQHCGVCAGCRDRLSQFYQLDRIVASLSKSNCLTLHSAQGSTLTVFWNEHGRLHPRTLQLMAEMYRFLPTLKYQCAGNQDQDFRPVAVISYLCNLRTKNRKRTRLLTGDFVSGEET